MSMSVPEENPRALSVSLAMQHERSKVAGLFVCTAMPPVERLACLPPTSARPQQVWTDIMFFFPDN